MRVEWYTYHMDSFTQMHIFFFITSVAVVLLTILIAIALYYVIKATRNLHSLSEKIKNGFEQSEEFIMDLKDRFESNMILRLFFPPSRKRRHNKTKDDTIE